MSAHVAMLSSMKIAGGGGGGGSLAVENAWKDKGSGTSIGVTVSPSSGNLLVVALFEYAASGTDSAMSDNIDGATGWTKVRSQANPGNLMLSLWYKKNIPSGITTVTGTCGASGSYPTMIVHEVSGASASAPFTTGEDGGNNGSSSNPATPSITNATAASIFFAVASHFSSVNPSTYTLNASGTVGGTTWALKSSTNSQELNGYDWVSASVPYKIASSSASTAHAWTFEASEPYVTIIAAFH